MTEYIAYYRVSSQKQGVSGLGLEAQREAVRAFIGGVPSQEYVEVESGRKASRPKLEEAIVAAKKSKATLIVAKLDRLTRNARFLLGIVESNIDVLFCDLPELQSGPMGKFFLTMMAAVAELESGMISQRTKAALAVAKANGVKLGTTGKIRAAENKAVANEFAKKIIPALKLARDSGCDTYGSIAKLFNEKDIKSPKNGIWHPQTVKRVMDRLNA